MTKIPHAGRMVAQNRAVQSSTEVRLDAISVQEPSGGQGVQELT